MYKSSAQSFYDSLAEDYHLVYQDWDRAMARQAEVIDALLQKYGPEQPGKLLDCTCGIGTQALGLSQLGYAVTGTDISPISIQRAQREATTRNLSILFQTADLRTLREVIQDTFSVVVSFDNSLPHLVEETDLKLAAHNIWNCLSDGGLFLGSMRDYNQLLAERPSSTKPVTSYLRNHKMITFQTWDWANDNRYTVNHFTLKEQAGKFATKVRQSTYRAYTRAEISKLFINAGFSTINWLMPEESGYYQPVFWGLKLG